MSPRQSARHPRPPTVVRAIPSALPMRMTLLAWGKANKEKRGLAAVKEDGSIRSDEEIAQRLGVASCHFNERQDVADAHGMLLESVCMDCSTLRS